MENTKTISELVEALKELTFLNEEYEKRLSVLTASNHDLSFQNKKLKSQEEATNERAARLVEALTIAKVGSWETNLQTMQVSWSNETRRIFGVEGDDEITSHANFMQFVHPEDQERVNEVFARSLNNSSVNEIEHRIITAVGDIKIVEQRWHTINHSGTKPTRSLGTVQDITERKRAEERVIESEAKYRAFFENSIDGILITVTDVGILAANPAACEIFGTTGEEICNGGRFSLIDTSDPRAENLIRESQLTGKAKGELTYLRKDGTSFPGEISSVVFKDSNGAVRTYMIIRDITERKNEERKLTAANDYLQLALDEINTLMDSSLDVICVVDVDGFFIKVSAASEVVWGYKAEELIGKSVFDYISKEDHSQTLEDVRRLKDGSSNGHFENQYIHKNGSLIQMEWRTTWDIKSRLRYGVGRDVTNRKTLEKAAEELRKSEQRNATLFEQNLAGFYQSTMQGKIINCNETFAKMLKYDSAKNLVNSPSSALYFSKDERSNFIKKALAQQKLNNYEGALKCKDGSALYFLENVSVHKDSETGEDLFDGIIIDITQRKQAQFQLEETQFAFIKSLEEKKVILESIADAFFAVDKDWIVTYWNNQAEKMLEKRKDEIIGKNLWEVFTQSTESLSYKKYYQAIETNTVVHFEDYYQPINKWYEISAYPLEGGLSVYFKDVSERKLSDIKVHELNENLQRQTDKLTVSNEELERFAYVTSHDLQEPLRMVSSFLQLLEKKYDNHLDETAHSYIKFAVDGAERMKILILDLLEFSRITAITEDHTTISLNDVIAKTLMDLKIAIDDSNAVINAASLPQVCGNQSQLLQLFENIIANAIKYKGHSPPVISIGYIDLPGEWQFHVQDNGIGIDEKFYEKVFIIFQRLHNRKEYKGTGIGLAICKKIVELHGGRIWVESVKDQGSKFCFTIKKLQVSNDEDAHVLCADIKECIK